MEIKKISFKNKNDVTKEFPLDDKWWYKCNHDCTTWALKTLKTKYYDSTSPCYSYPSAKGSIWC